MSTWQLSSQSQGTYHCSPSDNYSSWVLQSKRTDLTGYFHSGSFETFGNLPLFAYLQVVETWRFTKGPSRPLCRGGTPSTKSVPVLRQTPTTRKRRRCFHLQGPESFAPVFSSTSLLLRSGFKDLSNIVSGKKLTWATNFNFSLFSFTCSS